jgi:hypothetical protein
LVYFFQCKTFGEKLSPYWTVELMQFDPYTAHPL